MGRPSRWNGKAFLVRSLSFAGAAHYDDSISVSELIYTDPDLRWRTMIHEALHTFSPSYTRSEYNAAQGWEEGVVEQMQRLLRLQVLAALRVTVQEEVLTSAEADHQYNAYIALQEDLRLQLHDVPFGFYRMLLSTPLPQRALVLRQIGMWDAGEQLAMMSGKYEPASEDATMLTGTDWQYIIVHQSDYERLLPDSFADLSISLFSQ